MAPNIALPMSSSSFWFGAACQISELDLKQIHNASVLQLEKKRFTIVAEFIQNWPNSENK